MKRMKLTALLLALVLLLCACAGTASPTSASTPVQSASSQPAIQEADSPVRLEDDFYNYINSEWLATAVIPSDSSQYSAFKEVQAEIDETLRADMDALRDADELPDDELLAKLVQFYRMASNYDQRNADGFEPLLPYLEKILAPQSLAEYNAQGAGWALGGFATPYSLDVDAGFDDSTTYALHATSPSLILGNRSYYEEARDVGEQTKQGLEAYYLGMFELAGFSPEDAKQHWQQALAFDELLVPLSLTSIELHDSVLQNNPMPYTEFAALSQNIDFIAIAMELLGYVPNEVIVNNPRYFEAIDQVVNEETFPLMQSWMLVLQMDAGDALTEEARQLNEQYSMTVRGQAEPTEAGKAAYELATDAFSDLVDQYYGETYCGEETRQDVTAMIEQIVDVYRSRLQQNEWLSEETRVMAIRKLDAITPNVGWPDKLPETYNLYDITLAEEGGTLYENIQQMQQTAYEYQLTLLGQPVDRTIWTVPSHTVNAFYDPSANCIYIPASILNAPFYDPQQSESANLGGIGVVIGHEISHAFDSSGSTFDENGNLANWWTDDDHAKFEEHCARMVALFDGIEYAGGTVNGELTVTENVADAGGVACIIELLSQLDEPNYEECFESFARTWRRIMTPELRMHYLTTDYHAPSIFRTNIQLGNCDTFYQTYAINEDDGMYIPPENRVVIW